jgi:uncharacterized protein YhaN
MKILKMTASFGKLQKKTLTLHGGLNVVTAPNEAGKSTWAAFLTAMLYGVDSSERASRGAMPVKTKYKPWSGAPMEGVVELEWNNQRVTIERSSRGRVPMGEFSAYNTVTGEPVPELTAENCGQTLLGAPRAVFERSALLQSRTLAVTPDAALEKRLSSLVTTGDEAVSAIDSAQRLRDWKNRCRHNKTGLLPQKEAELASVETLLSQIRDAHRDDLRLVQEKEELQKKQAQLNAVLAALNAQETAKKLAQKNEARQAMEQAAAHAKEMKDAAASLPDDETLAAMAKEAAMIEAEAGTIPGAPPVVPEEPACPPVFAGLKENEILPKAQKDGLEFDRLASVKHRPAAVGFAALALAVIALGLFFWKGTWILLAAAAVLAALGAVWLILAHGANQKYEQARRRMDALLDAYERRSRDEFTVFAAQYHEALLVRQQAARRAEETMNETQKRKQALQERRARLLGQVSMFAPEEPDPARAVAKAQERRQAARDAAREALGAKVRCEAVETAFGDLQETEAPKLDVSGCDRRQIAQELLQCNSAVAAVRSRLDLSRGRVDALGDPAALEAQREKLKDEIAALEERYDALSLAEQTLAQAGAELQTRFSPRLSAMAGELMGRLTGGRYDRVYVDQSMNLTARETGEPITRELLSLSCGTADQAYLAVRLAICRLTLPPDAPLVLDDTFVNFDDERMKKALSVLREEAETRQILLFTCQTREQAALDSL